MNEQLNSPKRWRIVRRICMSLAILATLSAIFYTVENWRGKRAWEKCKADLEAKGAVLDWDKLIPPPVPDDQNFFKVPMMSEWFIKGYGRIPGDVSGTVTNKLSVFVTNGNKVIVVTNTSVAGGYNSNTIAIITNLSVATDYLAWSSQFEPQFDMVRAALKRPYARMDGDYTVPMNIPIPNFVSTRALAQVLAQRTKCHLLLGQPELALRDITLLNDSRKWLEAAPSGKPMTLVAAMVNVAITGLYVDTVAYGLEKHCWQEPQLLALQKQLAAINLAPVVAAGFAFEPAAVCRDLETIKLSKLFAMIGSQTRPNFSAHLFDLIPRGWIYQNMAAIARLEFQEQDAFDQTNRLVHPATAKKVSDEVEQIVLHARFSPYSFLTAIAIPNLVRATQSFAQNQTKVNEAQIVCALERYKLTNGNYPETLDALTPQFIEILPHDIIGGQPLHYRRTEEGKFLLYSVGWNETDDAGLPGTLADAKKGDWVWKN